MGKRLRRFYKSGFVLNLLNSFYGNFHFKISYLIIPRED